VGELKLASLKSGAVSYLALEISGAAASLVGLEDVLAFNAWDIGVLFNSVSDPAADKLDWASFLPGFFSDDLTADVDLSISGAASLNVLDGLVVLKVDGFEMQLGKVSGDDGTTHLIDAQAMTVTLTDVTLWVGPGGSLSDPNNTPDDFSDDTVEPGDLGFL